MPLAFDAEPVEAPVGRYPDQAMGDAATDGWKAYVRLWRAHHENPANPSIRRFLGLPLQSAFESSTRRGRAAPRWLGWRPGSYAQVDTPHFVIYSRADAAASKTVAEDLERSYWIWTQMFFPLWEGSAQVTAALKDVSADVPIRTYLQDRSARLTARRKSRIVLFRDAREYASTLGNEIPGIERSTGFYSDEKQTTFLYGSATDDADTRRHEMVHQLFREATRSNLGGSMPGEDSGFWLIEGIAGYFESLVIDGNAATIGGWDAPRLQFARYRMLVGGDRMPMEELITDGRLAAQQRHDIARWYAHAIAQTHRLLDGGHRRDRLWVYRELAEQYKIKTDLPEVEPANNDLQSMQAFLKIDDAHLAANPPRRSLHQLCLAQCDITAAGLKQIPASPNLRWIDLARLPIDNDAIRRLVPEPTAVEQLTLEATRIDPELANWLGQAKRLRELDLSWTPMDDSVIASIKDAADLSVLWMTGTKISDESISIISGWKNLSSVDVQRSAITESGIRRLRESHPQIEINPLELRNP